MSEDNKKQIIEFVPFGTKDKIQLTIEIVKRLVAVKTKTGKTASDEDAFKFMLMCQARKLNPFEGDAYLIGYDSRDGTPSFSLITAHQAFLKRAELHPEFDGMESGTIVLREGKITDLIGDWHMPTDKILGGWATVFFKNRKHPMTKRVRLERFRKNYGIWMDDPAGMIVKCAEADALRSSFPTMLGGMFISEELPAAKTADEIARPVFPATDGGSDDAPVVQAEVVEEPRGDIMRRHDVAKAEEPKKKVPTLTRKKSQTAPSVLTETKTPPLSPQHEKLKELLAIGSCTPQDFVQVALDQEWIELAQGTFEKIPADRVAEFLKDENWNFIMTLLDEQRAKRSSEAAERGNLL